MAYIPKCKKGYYKTPRVFSLPWQYLRHTKVLILMTSNNNFLCVGCFGVIMKLFSKVKS